MGKLSGLPTETSFALSDFLVKVKAAGAGDVKVTLANLLAAINANPGVISSPTLTNPYKFRAYLNANQSVSVSTFTKVALDTKSVAAASTTAGSYDTGGNFDAATNHRFTAPIAGFYFFNGRVGVESVASRVLATLYKNGTEASRGADFVAANASVGGAVVSDLLQLAAGDYIELWTFTTGTTLSSVTNDGPAPCQLSGYLVSAA